MSRGDPALAGRVAVVTGAGRGLGQFVAAGIAAQGACVAVVARSADQVQETVDQILAAGGEALPCVADVSDPDAVRHLAQAIHDRWGAVSVLINAAGIFGPIQCVEDSDPQRWMETLSTNLVGPYLTCRAFVGGMKAAGWGRIINFSSAAALHVPGPLNSAYGTSKVALNQFTRHLAAEFAGTQITVNVIHPGEVKTRMWSTIRDESRSTGPIGQGFREWADAVEKSGGDPPQKALDLVLEIIRQGDASLNGKFLWIRGGIQKPISSW